MIRSVNVYIAGNIVYVSGTVNSKAYTWTLTADHTWSAEVDRDVNDVYEIHIEATNNAGTVKSIITTVYYGLHLITDRKGGFYNASDLNRVEAAVEYLTEQFDSLPSVLAEYLESLNVAQDDFFAVPYEYPLPITTKTNWTDVDTQNEGEITRYLSNVKKLKETIALPNDTPELPASMNKLRVNGANDIEKVLRIVNDATLDLEALKKMYANNTAAAFWYSGELFSGEV